MLIFYCNPHNGNMNNIKLTTANIEKLFSLPRLLARYLCYVVIYRWCYHHEWLQQKAYLTKLSVQSTC